MDVLSGASSAIAVVSLAIQLAESTKKLYDFWKSVDEAPSSIQRIVADLKLVSNVLAEIAQHEQRYGQDGSVVDVLACCMEQIKVMVAMTTQLQHGLQSTSARIRKWSAIKAVFKEDSIAKFQSRLMDAKTTLILVRQTLSDKSIHTYFDHNGQMLLAMTQDMETLREQNIQTAQILGTFGTQDRSTPCKCLEEITAQAVSHVANPYVRSGFEKAIGIAIKEAQKELERDQVSQSPSQGPFLSIATRSRPVPRQWRVLKNEKSRTSNCFFGDITVQSQTSQTTFDKGDGRKEEEIDDQVRIIFRPATWLMRLGLAYELHLAFFQSSRVWKGVFQMYQPVPDDSLIFEFCRTGNIEGVQLLLSRKGASVWDVNSNGWTPLHFAIHGYQLETAKLLLVERADSDTFTYSQHSCLDILFNTFGDNEEQKVLDNFVDLVTLFVHQLDWGGKISIQRCGLEHCFCWAKFEKTHALIEKELPDHLLNEMNDRYIRHLAQSLDAHLKISEGAKRLLCAFLIGPNVPSSTITWATNLYSSIIDTRLDPDGYSVVLECIANNQWDTVEAFAKSGAGLHHIGFQDSYSPIEESATSLALYNSENFFAWRGILRGLETDMEKFIDDELQNGRLQKDGWNAQALHTLFRLEFSPVYRHENCWHCECGNRHLVYMDGTDDEEDAGDDDGDQRCGYITGVMVEVDWQKLLERIKHGEVLDGYIDKSLEDSESESQDSYDRDRDIVEISDAEVSDEQESNGEEENQQHIVAGEEDIGEEKADEDIDAYWEDVSQDNESEEGEEEEDDYESPEWFCITCWHNRTNLDTSSTPTHEVDSDAEDSPMLLKIGI